MTETRIDELLDKADSKFALVIGAAKRTRQITDFLNAKSPGDVISEKSAPPPVTELMTKKPLMIAIDEIADGKINIDYIEPSEEEVAGADVDEPVETLDEDPILEKKSPEETMEEGEPQEQVDDALNERSEE
ncbi:MAG: DNA-directed RNA polymerase subunit omega [Actinomycetota bacterium]